MDTLVLEQRMLTGLTVVYGNQTAYSHARVGCAREVRLTGAGFVDDKQALTSDTLYDLASLTKLFTAVSVLQLVEQGHLRLTDRIGHVDARFPALSDTTVEEVLTYHAVLRTPERVDEQPDAERAEQQVFAIKRARETPERLYSDMNGLLLGVVVEQVSGLPYDELLKQSILAPAGMNSTFAPVPPDRLTDCVDYNHEHRVINGEYQVLSTQPPGQPHDPKARLLAQGGRLCGHAGLFSTADDMARFAQALLSGKLLKRQSLMQMGVNRTGYNDQRGYRQYLGCLCFAKSPVQRLSELPSWMGTHAIGMSGYTGNHFALDPDQGVFDVFLGNRCHNRVSRILPERQAGELGLPEDGAGDVIWPDGRRVASSYHYIYKKDDMLHKPVRDCLVESGMMGDK